MSKASRFGTRNSKKLAALETLAEVADQHQAKEPSMLCGLLLKSPTKSTRRASTELGVLQSTIVKILNKRLQFHAYKIQIVQSPCNRLNLTIVPNVLRFVKEILDRFDKSNDYLQHVAVSDEATFHVSGKVNRHNLSVSGSEIPDMVIEHYRDSAKVNLWCCLMHNKIIGPFVFAEPTILCKHLLGHAAALRCTMHSWQNISQSLFSNKMARLPIGASRFANFWTQLSRTDG